MASNWNFIDPVALHASDGLALGPVYADKPGGQKEEVDP
jgi:hypothetical protein